MGSGRDKNFHVVNSCYKETIDEVNAYGTSWPISVPTLVAVLEGRREGGRERENLYRERENLQLVI